MGRQSLGPGPLDLDTGPPGKSYPAFYKLLLERPSGKIEVPLYLGGPRTPGSNLRNESSLEDVPLMTGDMISSFSFSSKV